MEYKSTSKVIIFWVLVIVSVSLLIWSFYSFASGDNVMGSVLLVLALLLGAGSWYYYKNYNPLEKAFSTSSILNYNRRI